MDTIEQLIRNKLDDIGNEQPTEGHLQRFEMKLTKVKQRSKYWIGFISGIAAVLLIGVFFFFNTKKQEIPTSSFGNISTQYAEVEFFYTNTITHQTNKLKEIASILDNNDTTIKVIIKELEDYDKEYEQLCTEMKAMPNDERVIGAMIYYYKTKLEIVNRILNELENRKLNDNSHENTSI